MVRGHVQRYRLLLFVVVMIAVSTAGYMASLLASMRSTAVSTPTSGWRGCSSTSPQDSAHEAGALPNGDRTRKGFQDARGGSAATKMMPVGAEDVDCPCPISVYERIGRRDDPSSSTKQQRKTNGGGTSGDGEETPDEKAVQSCLEFLSNYSNVGTVEAMLATARFGRTVKMKLSYRFPEESPKRSCKRPIFGVVKLPQSLFPLEPYAEYVAYEIDQALGMNYVPPTSWIFIPLADIEGATFSSLNGMKEKEASSVVPHDAKLSDPREVAAEQRLEREEEALGANITKRHEFSRWVSKEALMYAVNHNLVVARPDDGRLSIGCSVQLWVAGARTASGTPLMYQLDAAVSWLSLTRDASGAVKRVEVPPPVASGEKKGVLGKTAASEAYRQQYLADVFLFDALIANDDRGPIKNTNVFRLKGKDLSSGHVEKKAPYRFLNIDQGKSFYLQGIPKNSAFRKAVLTASVATGAADVVESSDASDEEEAARAAAIRNNNHNAANVVGSMCVCRKESYRALRRLTSGAGSGGDGTFSKLAQQQSALVEQAATPQLLLYLREVVPEPILRHIGVQRLKWLQRRVDRLSWYFSNCLNTFGEDAVFL